MLTLDEAIEHAEEKAKENCGECSENHKQLAIWLNELKYYKENWSKELRQRRSNMIDIRIVGVVDDTNESILSHKTKFKLEERKCGIKLLYADIELCWFNLFSNDTVHIVIPREDIRVDLGLLFGERIIVSKCVAHIIIDKIMHTNSVHRLMWEYVTKENENDKN